MSSHIFGFSKLVNEDVILYNISNKNNVKANILSLGAAVQSLHLPWKGLDSENDDVNVVLGYDNVTDYEKNECYIGVVVGRVAGRISHGCFNLDGKKCKVTLNHGENCLHGGKIGLSRKNWTLVEHVANSVTLRCTSADGEEGFPGELHVSVQYTVTEDDSLAIEYSATVHGHASPVNLTNHSYFNLSGIGCVGRGVRDHIVSIRASRTLQLDADLLPTGTIVPLEHPLDLRDNQLPLDSLLASVGGSPPGYDLYYILDEAGSLDRCQATVSDRVTKMSLFTDQRGVQFYTANFFEHVAVAGGLVHHRHGALCLEAQNYPDAPNHDRFPSTIVNPGETYSQKTVYKFERL